MSLQQIRVTIRYSALNVYATIGRCSVSCVILKEFERGAGQSYYRNVPLMGFWSVWTVSAIISRLSDTGVTVFRISSRANVFDASPSEADRCEGIAKTANTREARVASGRHAAVMRVAIFKMVENRETTVSEMINRSIRCFPTRSTVPANVASFTANRSRYFAMIFGERHAETLLWIVLIHRDRFAIKRSDLQCLSTWNFSGI